ncbi:MAG: GPI2-domain-containing protein [Lasallia pustulata]|uniref:GPI2-domain-containing protein n=1 Tax=Lasallia pustulata TaxID=136370 RepID=A0A5M8PFZ4_9LECA|nr:MAG: GPI2-domain-containing protein [Lasallia pustulata]
MTPSQAIHASSPLHDGFKAQQSPPHQTFSDPNHLAPEDAFLAHSPPRKQRDAGAHARSNGSVLNGELASARAGKSTRRPRDKERGRSGSRRRKGVWKKLLWVKQPYPDNYTDPPSFLSHLQRNPRLLPYDFWPLVADSTVIVQHICSVAIFLCCFAGIIQQRVSPVAVVNCGSASTLLGYLLWDFWLGREEAAKALHETTPPPPPLPSTPTPGPATPTPAAPPRHPTPRARPRPRTPSPPAPPPPTPPPPARPPAPRALSARNQQRLATAKSAVLIYSALLGLSPILKSLTKSTTSDSIWAMSTWLMCINVFFFDYGGGAVGVPFPASLSTNAALMASTVLASRLPSTTHVFSLTLFI